MRSNGIEKTVRSLRGTAVLHSSRFRVCRCAFHPIKVQFRQFRIPPTHTDAHYFNVGVLLPSRRTDLNAPDVINQRMHRCRSLRSVDARNRSLFFHRLKASPLRSLENVLNRRKKFRTFFPFTKSHT